MMKPKALYFFIGKSSFVDKDISIFSESFELIMFHFSHGQKWKIPFQLLSQFFFLMRNLLSFKICIIQLAGIHSVLPVLFSKLSRKKSVIVAGGTDCHSFPSIGYGNYQRPLLAFSTRLSFKNCSLIIPKHQTLWRTKYTYDDNDFPEQGISYFNEGIKTPYSCVENGYDAGKFIRTTEPLKNSFITIAGLLDKSSQQKLKGIDLIIEIAKKFPYYKFTILGGKREYFHDFSDNIQFLPSTPNSELPDILSRHQYYLQLSMAEGFPNALCEAMLCECIPIGSDVFSIPEIISDTGYILKKRSADSLQQLIESLPDHDIAKNGKSARERISRNFTIENRKNKLKAILEQL